jgi:membrane-bound ClpP family serine protease
MIGLIIGLIIVGIVLILLELLVIPGTTLVGIVGIISIGLSIYLSYKQFGTTTGNYILISAVVLFIVALFFVLRSNTWKKASLDEKIDSKIAIINDSKKYIGQTALTITRLNPIGKININGEYYEAKSYYNIIEPQTEVEIINIEGNTFIVKPKI